MAKKATTKKSGTGLEPKVQQTLHNWNQGIAAIFAVEAIGIVFAGSKFSEAVTVRYPSIDKLTSDATGQQVLATATRHLFDLRMAWAAAAILLVFAGFYALISNNAEHRYLASLERGVNKFRWLMLAVGGGLMFMALSLLSGLNDIATLGLIGFSIGASALLALAVELLGAERPGLRKLLGALSGIGFALPWLIIAKGAIAAAMYGGHIPAYLWAIYSSMLLFSVAFVTATCFRWKRRGQWSNVLYAEKMFLLLSFAAASALAWQIAAGVR